MEKTILKYIGKEIDEIQAKNELCKLAVVSKTADGKTVYVLLKMVSFTCPLLNNDGTEVPEKKWKNFFPFVVKSSYSSEYIFNLFDLLSIIGVSDEP